MFQIFFFFSFYKHVEAKRAEQIVELTVELFRFLLSNFIWDSFMKLLPDVERNVFQPAVKHQQNLHFCFELLTVKSHFKWQNVNSNEQRSREREKRIIKLLRWNHFVGLDWLGLTLLIPDCHDNFKFSHKSFKKFRKFCDLSLKRRQVSQNDFEIFSSSLSLSSRKLIHNSGKWFVCRCMAEKSQTIVF